MATANHTSKQQIIQRAALKHGRTVTILQSDNTTEVEAGKPWKGYVEADVEITGVPALSLNDFGQLLSEITDWDFSSLIRRDAEVLLIAKLDVPDTDITAQDKVIDTNKTFAIEQVRTFRPGELIIFYAVVLKS